MPIDGTEARHMNAAADPYAPKLYLSKAQIRALHRAGIELQDLSINMEVGGTEPVPKTLPHQLSKSNRRKIRGHSVSEITFDEFRGEDE